MENTNMFGPIIQSLLITLIQVLLPIALAALVAFINARIKEVRASKDGVQFDTAVAIIERLVLAAEQNGMIGAIENAAEAKKKYVLDLAEAELAKRGIVMDLDAVDALIEAQVNEAFGKVVLHPEAPTQPVQP